MHSILRAVLLGAVCTAGLPREGQAQRQVKHLNTLAAAYGAAANGGTHDGHFYQLGYSRFISDKTRFDVVARHEAGSLGNRGNSSPAPQYDGFDLGLGVAPRLFRIGEVFYLHLTTQLHLRYDHIKATETWTGDKRFSAGPRVGLDADVYLADWLSLTGQATQGYLLFHSPLGKWPQYYGGGLSVHFR